ncbi:prephenate dehydrogenase/arogenate dehydrogenase family protein [Candidatus Gracilibacteria bacterium]|nr:prephenate dehydrogenase/arogenate dehydrogenase family protein [Candidatus Gracilibacteria bacterium]
MEKLPKNPVIGIVGGRGVLGRVFREAFEDAGFEVLISGRKPNGKKILSNKNLVKVSDVVIVSVFLKDTEKVIRELVPLLSSRQLFVDFASLKSRPVAAMLKSKAEVVGLHPMFGGVKNLRGKNIFACPARGKKWWRWLRKILEDSGLKIHEISPQKHDELTAVHQAATHLSNLAFAQLLRKRKIAPAKLFKIASPSTQLLLLTIGRMLNQDLEMYADISLTNPAMKKTATELTNIFGELTNEVTNSERAKLLKNFEEASKFFGKWKDFAEKESERIFENLTEKETPTVSQSKIEVKKTQKKVDFAVLGQNTQTQLAMFRFAKKIGLIGDRDKEITIAFHKEGFSPKSTIPKVFEAVTKKAAKWGFIPLENYSIGPVRETMRQLFEANGKIKIWSEFTHEIHHALFGRKDLSNEINNIFAHPQAHAQCDKFLRKNYPKANLAPVANAGEAIRLAVKNSDALAIGPSGIIPQGLISVQNKIEDDKNNLTRFVAICKSPPTKWGVPQIRTRHHPQKTALTFFFRENRSGQLAAALEIFAQQKINLSRIESIPTEKKRGEFFFFTECELNPRLPAALKKLSKIASVVELGNY